MSTVSTVIETPDGRIRGRSVSTTGPDIEEYLGIPFASPPVGDLRFRPPAPVQPWQGVRDATRYGPGAPQNPDPVMVANGIGSPPWSESECLNLNVWTPGRGGDRRAVMVWIHGGAYLSGSNAGGLSSGAELASNLDVVVVSVNYRLGILGFLHLGHVLGEDYADSANVAILDQIAALQWVRRAIGAFGGDPENVTVFGESAGGAAVATLLGTPQAKGLFHRAIVQSGTAERARGEDASIAATTAVLASAGLDEARAPELIDMPIERLLEVQQKFCESEARGVIGISVPFQPLVGAAVLPISPLDSIRSGLNSQVDLLVGTNLNEGSFFVDGPSGDERTPQQKVEVLLDDDLEGRVTYPQYLEALSSTLGTDATEAQALESYLSDRQYRQPTQRMLDARAGAEGRTYSYLFTWPSPLLGGRFGACHVLEVPFVLRQLHSPEAAGLVGDSPPVPLCDAMSEAWVMFARQGVPQSAGLPDWPQYSPPSRETMILDRESVVESDPRSSLRTLWSSQN